MTVLNNSNDFCRHPIYDRYEANREGIVRHIENKRDIGYSITNIGYIRIDVRCRGHRKHYLKTSIYF